MTDGFFCSCFIFVQLCGFCSQYLLWHITWPIIEVSKNFSEAIRAELPGLGCAGYVANSPYTVLGDCLSAGRLYDKIGREATAKVVYVLENAVVCKVKLNGSELLCNNNLPQPETAGLHIL